MGQPTSKYTNAKIHGMGRLKCSTEDKLARFLFHRLWVDNLIRNNKYLKRYYYLADTYTPSAWVRVKVPTL